MKFFYHILILLIVISFTALNFTFCQSPFFKTIDLFKNHRSVSVYNIFQDSKGYIWLSTEQGLVRYDGTDSYLFRKQDSISQSLITAISEDSIGQIWLGHKDGTIEYLSDNYFKKFQPEEGLSKEEISFIKFDSKGVLWFGTLGEGIYYYQGSNRKRLFNISQEDGLSDNYVYTFVESKNGYYFFGTDNGISIIDRNNNKVISSISMKNGLPDNIVKHLEIEDYKLWIGMDEKGVCIYDLINQEFSLLPEWNFGTLNTFTLKNNNECWISTKNQGIIKLKFDNNKLSFLKKYSSVNGLQSNESQTIFTDREKNLWVANSKELVLIVTSAFEFIEQKSDGLDLGNVFSFIADTKGCYWAATQNGLFCITYDVNGKTIYSKVLENIKEIQNAFISLYLDSEGFIWAGTYGYGVYRINPENQKYEKFDITNGLCDNNILYITGMYNKVWFATAGGGASLYTIDNSKFQTFNSENGLGSNYVFSIFIDSKDNTWFALDGKGTSILQNGKINNSFLPDSLNINTIYSITEDSNGTLWFLTSDKGLLQFKNEKFKIFDETNGLKSNNSRSLRADKFGNIIIASNDGIQVFLNHVEIFETFGEERGVAYKDPNLNGMSSDSTGSIWISSNNGIIKYSPVPDNQQIIKPQINISRILLFLNPLRINKTEFSYDQNHLTFEYNGFWFQSSEKLLYSYKLENYDKAWSMPTSSKSATYSNLPPGKYVFSVKVSSKPGIWITSDDAKFTFSISPPFYKTWWFISLCILFIIFSIYYFIKLRTAKLLKDKQKLEVEVVNRTKTISKQKEEISAQRDFVIIQRDKIEEQNKNITYSIQYARRIQQATLPNDTELKLLLKDYFVLNRPMDIVSGDFYWLTKKNSRTLIAVADCTGHGVSGAFMSVLGISLLNKIIFLYPDLSASEILDNLREEVKFILKQSGKIGENQDGMDIFLLIIDNDNQTYQYSGANNPGYIFTNNELTVLSPDKMPIGIYPKETLFKNNAGQLCKGVLCKGDILYLSSDGYQDQFGGEKYVKFKSKPFRELLKQIGTLPLNEQCEILDRTMNEWKAGHHQNDDILVLGFKIN